mgnify:CR=1 FL=1
MQNTLFSLNVFVRSIVVLAVLAAAFAAHAQGYPTRSIRYIVAQAPGGSSDTLARVLAPRLAAALGVSQPAMTKTMAKLADAALVHATPGATDKRQSVMELTDAGRAAVRQGVMAKAPE